MILISDLFEKYGPVHNIVRKGNFCSIEFENGCDALRAKRGLDGVDYHGRRLNIDWYRDDRFPKLEGKNWWGGRPGHPRYKNRCIVLGLPPTVNHQDVLVKYKFILFYFILFYFILFYFNPCTVI